MTNSKISKAYEGFNIMRRNSRGLTVEEFSRELNVSVRQAYRYLSELTNHFPVCQDTGGVRRYRLMELR